MTLVPLTSPLSALQFDSQWRALPGMAHGLGQPVMLGKATVPVAPHTDLAALDDAMADFVTEPLPSQSPPDSSEFSLVLRALFWATAVQRQFNIPVFGAGQVWLADNTAEPGAFRVAMPYAARQASIEALAWVELAFASFVAGGASALQGSGPVRQDFERLKLALQGFRLQGVNPFRLLKAAHELDIPVRHVVGDVYCFGTGRTSRWMESSYTDKTSVVGTRIARDKVMTALVLRQAGLPAPRHALASSEDQALRLANQLGYPVVVKPSDRDQGLGVAADLRNDAAVLAAFREAAKHSENILVEKHFDGQDYRFTVLNGRLIKTIVRRPGGVTGDGLHTIAQLVELGQKDAHLARRSRERGQNLLELDREAMDLLAEYLLVPQSILAAGRHVGLRRRANVSAGGTPFLVEEAIHPDNRSLAERAAAALHLDLAGIDVIMQDVSRSWLETGALICEVNAQPQIGSSTSPGIYMDILRELLPRKCRLPVVLVVGASGTVRDHLQRMAPAAFVVGGASPNGVWQGQERLTGPQISAFAAGQILMANQSIDLAVIAMTPAQILLSGLPFERCGPLILLGAGNGPAWSQAELSGMWRMALPHVTDAIIVPAGQTQYLPAKPELEAYGLNVTHCADDDQSVAQAAASLLFA